MSDEVRFKILHSNKNFIDLDASQSDEYDDEDDDENQFGESPPKFDPGVPETKRGLRKNEYKYKGSLK